MTYPKKRPSKNSKRHRKGNIGKEKISDVLSTKEKLLSKYCKGKLLLSQKINLLSPYEMSDEEINYFRSDLREVLLYVKYSKDKEKLKEMKEKDEKFHHLDRQTADVINVITNSKLKFDEKEGKKAVNMCKAIMDIREEGRVLQFIKDVRQFHFMDEPGMVVYLMEEFGLSKEEAEKKLKETS